jgi:flagellar protein FliS
MKGGNDLDRKRAKEMYVKNMITTASPAEMAAILLQESLTCIKKARLVMEDDNRFEQNVQLKRAQQCVLEIVPFFNDKIKEGQAASLVYQHVNSMLVEANVKSDASILAVAEEIVSSLMEAWQESRKA